ncbi:MAG TPA: hypothetical protein VFW94_23295 [Candidatus Acidoferrales bacterium]|nr:hypothetical protein [Candidatus Acidoferrales bacterium]
MAELVIKELAVKASHQAGALMARRSGSQMRMVADEPKVLLQKKLNCGGPATYRIYSPVRVDADRAHDRRAKDEYYPTSKHPLLKKTSRLMFSPPLIRMPNLRMALGCRNPRAFYR